MSKIQMINTDGANNNSLEIIKEVLPCRTKKRWGN